MKSLVMAIVLVLLINVNPVQAGDMLELTYSGATAAFWYHYESWKKLDFATQVIAWTDYGLVELLAGPTFTIGPVLVEVPVGIQLDLNNKARVSRLDNKVVAYNTKPLPLGLNFLSLNVFRWGQGDYTDQVFLRQQVYRKHLGVRWQGFKNGGEDMHQTVGPLIHYKLPWLDGHVYLYYGFDPVGDNNEVEVGLTLAKW